MANGAAAVAQFLAALDDPRKAEVAQLRTIILDADPGITEQIKWTAPSFCYRGDDRVTMRLHPKGGVQLIFHRGAKVKDSTDFAFEDSSSLMQWATKDRAIVTFHTLAEITAQQAVLEDLVRRWVAATVE
jgi:hypothetical protein